MLELIQSELCCCTTYFYNIFNKSILKLELEFCFVVFVLKTLKLWFPFHNHKTLLLFLNWLFFFLTYCTKCENLTQALKKTVIFLFHTVSNVEARKLFQVFILHIFPTWWLTLQTSDSKHLHSLRSRKEPWEENWLSHFSAC